MVDNVANALQPTTSPIQGCERRGPLRREGETVDDGRVYLSLDRVPLMDVPVKDVSLFDAAVNDSKLDGVPGVIAVRWRVSRRSSRCAKGTRSHKKTRFSAGSPCIHELWCCSSPYTGLSKLPLRIRFRTRDSRLRKGSDR